jgi:hypothetical protein
MGQRNSRRQQGSGPSVTVIHVNDASTGTSRQRSASSNAHKSSGKKRTTSSKTTSSEPNVKASGQQQQRYYRHSLTTAATASSSKYNNSNNNNNGGPQQLHQQRPNVASSSRHHQNHVTTSTSLNRATNYDVTDSAAAAAANRASSPLSSLSNTMKPLNLRGVSTTDRQAYILHQANNSRTIGRAGYKTFIAQPVIQVEMVKDKSGSADRNDASPTYNGSKPHFRKQNSLPVGASAMDYYDNEQQRQQQQLDEHRQLYWPSDEQRSSSRHRQDAAAAGAGATASTTSSHVRRRPADQHEVRVMQYQSDYDVSRRPDHEVAVVVTKEYEDVALPNKSAAHRANHDVRASYQSDTDDVFRGNETTSRTHRADRDETLTIHGHHHQVDSRDDATLSKRIRSREMRDQYQPDSVVASRRRQDDIDNVDRRTTGHSYSSRTTSVNRHLTNGLHDEAAAAALRSATLQPDMIDFPTEDETGEDVQMMNGAGTSDSAYQHYAEKRERKYKSLTLLPQDRDDRFHSYQHQQPSPSSHTETLEKRRAATHYATVEQQHNRATRGCVCLRYCYFI